MRDSLDSRLLLNVNAFFRSSGCPVVIFLATKCFTSYCGMFLFFICVSPSIPFMRSKGKSQIPAAGPKSCKHSCT